MARPVPPKDHALYRVSHIAAIKGVVLTGTSALALADFHLSNPKAEALMLRALRIANTQGVRVDGDELLKMAQFLA